MLMLLLAACRPEEPGDTGSTTSTETDEPDDEPSKVDEPCETNADCARDLRCIRKSPDAPYQVGTCQLPCVDLGCPGSDYACINTATPPWCYYGSGGTD